LRSVVFCAALLGGLVARPALAQETWQHQVGTFRVGVLAEPGDDAVIRGLSALKKAFALALGVPVEFFVAEDYRTLIEAQSEKRIDYAIYSATAYATAAIACDCVAPLVAPSGSNGALGVRSVLIARPDRFSSLAEMSKHRIALAGRNDVAGFGLPLLSLRKEGLTLTGDEPFFVRAGSAEEARSLLLAGEVDAIFGWIETGIGKTPLPGSGTLEKLAETEAPADAFSIVWTSDLLRYGPHAIGKDLDPEVRRRLLPFLTGLRDTDPALFETLARFQLGGFVSVNEADYEIALELVREASGPGGR
jgi:phosphonate transport system substrate-binding protein